MKYKRSFVNFFIENFRITYLLMVALVIFGVLAVIQMPKESAPEVDIPVVVITTPFPGAGAENVEDLITTPIENQVSGITEIENIDSSSQQGLSTVIIQFDVSADSSEMTAEVRDRVDRASSDFPAEAGESSIRKISFSDVPIMRMALAGPSEPAELKVYADQLKEELESVRDVSQVSILGSPEREIRIRLDERRSRDLSITPDMVIGALSRGNTDLPIGSIETGESVYTLRLDSKLLSAEDIRRVPVLEKSGALITVSDVAEVEDGFAPLGNISRFSIEGSQPKATVSLQVFKESGQGDILTIADSIKEKIDALQRENFPEDVEVEIIQSDAEVIRSDLNTLVSSGFLTIIIIVLTLTLFIGWREALQASLVVPFSFLAAFVFIEAFGLTINFLTLFSLILSLGILVDASIVVTESIFNKRSAGLSGCDAAQETIDDFQAPLIAGTMTTVFVFAPMLIMGGIMGEFIKSIPITVSAVLLSALFVALVFITTIATRFLVKPPVKTDVGLFGVGKAMECLSVWYRKKLSFILESKRAAYILLGSVTFLFILAVALPFIGVVSVNMFPSPDSDSIFIDLEASPGTPFDRTSDLISPIEEKLRQDGNVESFLTIIGQSSEAGSIDLAQAGDSNRGSITATLNENRDLTSQEILADYREAFKNYSDAEVRFSQPEAGPGGEGAVRINLIGEDLDELERVARELSGVLSSIGGTENVDDGIKSTAGEFVINIDRATAGRYDLNPSDIAGFLRTSLFGRTATEMNISEEEIGLVVLSDIGKERNTVGRSLAVDVSEIESMTIQTQRGPVALSTFIDIDLKPGRSSIEHRDGDRFLAITSDVAPGYNAQSIVANFRESIKEKDLPANVEITYGGEVEEIQESFMDLFKVMLIGVLLIFTLMVWQFKSYLQPFFILITVPLALTGVFFGLAIVRQPLSFPGFIGIVALVGIVVNNAIILIDVINKKYFAGEDLKKAILSGARSRFRPVVLTTVTTVLALVPLVFASPEWSPVAYSIIFGLLFSTVLTLVVIPVLYQKFSSKRK
ncbi:MAG: efflux RND transporter permease subunit [Patescibacteria group bacterium]